MSSRELQLLSHPNRAGLWSAIIAIALVVVVGGYLVVHRGHAAALQTVLPPAKGLYWGEAVTGGKLSTFQSRETMVGRKMDSWHFFQNFGDTLPTDNMKTAEASGHIVLMNWKPAGYTWKQVANGNADSYIATQADNIKAWGRPVIFNFHHEPENDTASEGSAADFVAAFDHVVTVFRNHGADNVSWAWIMMAGTFHKDIDSWYPGDNYVDWIGVDVYSLWEISNHKSWVSVQDAGDDAYNWATKTKAGAHNKPILYGEWATSEDDNTPGRKAQWITDALTTLKSWPQVKLVEYFDVNGSVITSTQSAQNAFIADGHDPYTNQPHVFGTLGSGGGTPISTPTPTATPTKTPTPTPTPSPTPTLKPTITPTPTTKPTATPTPTTTATTTPSPTPTSTTVLGVRGDVDNDGRVNIVDLSLLTSHWGQTYPPADFNATHAPIGIKDLSILLSHWTG